jgi:hypothetical protein
MKNLLGFSFLLVASTLCWSAAPPASGTHVPTATEARETLLPQRIRQNHGAVLRPENPCGVRWIVYGEPGTQFWLFWASGEAGSSAIIGGTVLDWGGNAGAYFATECPSPGALERVLIWSYSDAPIDVQVEFIYP